MSRYLDWDVFSFHEIEDQVERGPRVLRDQEAEWWGGERRRQEVIAARARHAQDLARIRAQDRQQPLREDQINRPQRESDRQDRQQRRAGRSR